MASILDKVFIRDVDSVRRVISGLEYNLINTIITPQEPAITELTALEAKAVDFIIGAIRTNQAHTLLLESTIRFIGSKSMTDSGVLAATQDYVGLAPSNVFSTPDAYADDYNAAERAYRAKIGIDIFRVKTHLTEIAPGAYYPITTSTSKRAQLDNYCDRYDLEPRDLSQQDMERIRTGLALQAPVPQPRIASYAGVNRNPVDGHPVPARLNETIAPPWDLEGQNLIDAANKARDAQIAEAKKAQANAEKFARQANKRIADWKGKFAAARGRDDGTQTDDPLVKQVGTQTNSVQIDATHDAVQGVVAQTAKGQSTSVQSGLRRSTRNTSKPAATAEPASVVPTLSASTQVSAAQNMIAPLTRSASVQANETQGISITATRPTPTQASLPQASGGPSMKPTLAQTGTTRASTARATRSASKQAGPVQASAPQSIPTQAGSSTTSKKRAQSEVEADDELAGFSVTPVAGPATAPKLKRRRKENLYDAETDSELSDEMESPKKKAPARAKTIAKAKANAGAATDTSQSGKRGRFKPDDERAQLEMVGKRQCNCCYGVFDLENFRMHTTKGVTKRVLYCQDCQDKKATSRKVKREGGQAEGGDREEEVGGDEEGQ